MKGRSGLTPVQEDQLVDRIKEFIRIDDELNKLQQKHAEFQGRLAHDLGKKKVAIDFGGGKVIESDGKNLKITETDIEVVT